MRPFRTTIPLPEKNRFSAGVADKLSLRLTQGSFPCHKHENKEKSKKHSNLFGGTIRKPYLCTRNSENETSLRFSRRVVQNASLAQLVEQLTLNQWV